MGSEVRARPPRREVRDRVLEHATEAFLRDGYAGVKVIDIATAAGFTKGAVYSNFGGKPGLFSAVWSERFEAIAGFALGRSELIRSGRPREEILAEVARELAVRLTETPGWATALGEFRLLAVRDPEVARTYAELSARQLDGLAGQLREHGDAIGLPGDFDHAVAAYLILTAATSLALEHAAAPAVTDRDRIEQCLAELLIKVLR